MSHNDFFNQSGEKLGLLGLVPRQKKSVGIGEKKGSLENGDHLFPSQKSF